MNTISLALTLTFVLTAIAGLNGPHLVSTCAALTLGAIFIGYSTLIEVLYIKKELQELKNKLDKGKE
jgi:hypothetical protein